MKESAGGPLVQAFLDGAGKQGVLLASLGTIAELGELHSVSSFPDLSASPSCVLFVHHTCHQVSRASLEI